MLHQGTTQQRWRQEDRAGGPGFCRGRHRRDGQWRVDRLPDDLQGDLDGLIQALRRLPAEGGAIGLVDMLGGVWPAGDVGIFADLGLSEQDLAASSTT